MGARLMNVSGGCLIGAQARTSILIRVDKAARGVRHDYA
jgi:hypothetical protein